MECIVVDTAGDIYVCSPNNNSIVEFGPSATGNATPISILGGSLTQMSNPTQVRFDSAGTMYVANPGNASVTVYPAGATGNMAPIRTVIGSSTGLNQPIGLSLSP